MSHSTNTLKPLLLSLLGATLALSLGTAFWYRTALAEMVINAWQGHKLTDGLVGYWSFDGADVDLSLATAEIRDRSGQGNHADWINHATTTTIGKIGQGISFDGVDDGATYGTKISFDSNDFTVSGWIRMNGAAGGSDAHNIIFSQRADATGNGSPTVSLYLSNTQKATFIVRDSVGAAITAADAATANFGEWYHVVGIKTGSAITLYVNGISVATQAHALSGDFDTNAIHRFLGKNRYSGADQAFLNGTLDDVRVYNRALSAEEVKRLYLMGNTFAINASQNQKLTEGLIGMWSFDGSDIDLSQPTAEIRDRSGQGNHGDWKEHATTTVIGRLGQAIDFDGIDDNVRIGTSPVTAFPVTISAWINIRSISATGKMIVNTNNLATTNYYCGAQLLYSNANFSMHQGDCTGTASTDRRTIAGGTVPVVSTWYHVVGVYIGHNNMDLYVNGVQETETPSGTGASTLFSAAPLSIGHWDADLDRFSDAIIDDVRVYNRALSAEEVKRLYLMGGSLKINTSRSYELSDGLVGHWSFDGSDIDWSLNKALDRSGQGNHGVFTNMATTTAPAMGKIGQGLTFDGSDDFIDLGTPSSLDLSGVNRFTLSAWVYPTSIPNGAGVITEMYNPTNSTVQYTIGFSNSVGAVSTTQPTVGFYNGAWRTAVEARDIDLNVWSHIVGTWDGTTLLLYRNGVQVAQSTPGGALPSANFDKVVIGKRHDVAGTKNFFPGKIDEVRVYNRALSAEEVKRLYLMGK